MSGAGDSPLSTIVDGLLATPTARLPYQRDVLLRSFLLQRPQGNLIVYNSPGLDEAASTISALGTPARLLINHGHESMYGQPHLDVPVWVHERDRVEVARSLRVDGVFAGPGTIDDDLEVIPTPGHTAGTTCYLWDNGTHRFLFTGDFIWIGNGRWQAVVLSPQLRGAYVESLELVRELDFDVLVPWGATEDGPPYALATDGVERRARIDAIIDRVRAGGHR